MTLGWANVFGMWELDGVQLGLQADCNASSNADRHSVSKGEFLVLCGLKLSSRKVTAVLKKNKPTVIPLTRSNEGHRMKMNSFQLLYQQSRSLVEP